jgi:Na+-transporting methylmalonyl-CoA/oxaloacetate decarboxylase gamma subunit
LESSLATTLVITAIGMSLLFLSLVLFYGIISLLTAVTKQRPAKTWARMDGATEPKAPPQVRALRAAAIAIALARAESEASPARHRDAVVLTPGDRTVSPWWQLHHQHQLAEMRKSRRFG